MTIKKQKVLVFGVFDGLHDGHRFFLTTAQTFGNLTIVVAPDNAVATLKDHAPRFPVAERIEILKEAFPHASIVIGDTEHGIWTPLKEEKPDIVLCGYDQTDLYTELQKVKDVYSYELHILEKNYKGNELHSRILNK